MKDIVLVGRSSSHFTRIARIFAYELGLEHAFEPVYEIASQSAETFADNPTLRVPSLRTKSGTWFGSMNVSRELARLANRYDDVIWPEHLVDATSMNAQEIVTETMAAEVTIVMARAAKLASDHAFLAKPLTRVDTSLAWLERELPDVLARLSPGRLSFLEVSTFCLCTHLPFRELRTIDDCPNLVAFTRRFGDRESARATEYRFDVAQS